MITSACSGEYRGSSLGLREPSHERKSRRATCAISSDLWRKKRQRPDVSVRALRITAWSRSFATCFQVEGTQPSSNFHAARRRDTFRVMFATQNPTLTDYEAQSVGDSGSRHQRKTSHRPKRIPRKTRYAIKRKDHQQFGPLLVDPRGQNRATSP